MKRFFRENTEVIVFGVVIVVVLVGGLILANAETLLRL